jgi:hypothetical protein
MRLLLILLALLIAVYPAAGSQIFPAGFSSAEQTRQAIYVEQIDIQADENGTAAEETAQLVGELKAVILVNGNYSAAPGTYTLNYTTPRNLSIDSYNLSNVTTAIRAPRIDYNSTYPLFGKLWLNITSGMAWGQATAYVVYG